MATLDHVKFLFDEADKNQRRVQQAMETASAAKVQQTMALGQMGLSIGQDGTVTRSNQNPFLDAEVARATALGETQVTQNLQQARGLAEQG